MRTFHVFLHARPAGGWPRESLLVDGRNVHRTVIPAEKLSGALPITFEDAAEGMQSIPRMFLEPDGSFVWVSAASETTGWQLDGMLWDRGGQLQTVELKGHCPLPAFEQLLLAWRLDPKSLLVQLVAPAAFLEVVDFQRDWLDGE